MHQQENKNFWEQHFNQLKIWRLRAMTSKNDAVRRLVGAYFKCMEASLTEDECDNLKELLIIEWENRSKYLHYQILWNWNALAFQYYKFHKNFPKATSCLEQAFHLAGEFDTESFYGKNKKKYESLWLIILLNLVRLDIRKSAVIQAEEKIKALKSFLFGGNFDPSMFGGSMVHNYNNANYRFSFERDMVYLLTKKLLAEETMLRGLSNPQKIQNSEKTTRELLVLGF